MSKNFRIAASLGALVMLVSVMATISHSEQSGPRPTKGELTAQTGVEWCQTQIAFDRRYPQDAKRILAACPLEGNCDVPATRDANIPDAGDPPITIRLKFNIFRNDDGSSPAASVADCDGQLAQLNSDYSPARINFVYTYEFINDSKFRSFSDNEEFQMKTTYADQPDKQINVYIVNITGGYIGVGTFPWDPSHLAAMGGIIVDDNYFGSGEKTLTHELGHNLGLWHTHHGVSEVTQCSACWELADHSNGDVAGDFCVDTDPTPVNYNCSGPGGSDPCSGIAWGPTDPQNYMGYAPDYCYSEFTPQQWGRMHCWIEAELTSQIALGFTATPRVGETSLTVDFAYESSIPALAYKWFFGDGDSSTAAAPSHTYGPGVYDVTLTVTTSFGDLTTYETNFITVTADTLDAPDIEVAADSNGYWEIMATNAVPVNQFILPVSLTNVPSVIFFDSISFVGTRTSYFEQKQLVYDNRFAGQLAYRVTADNGGGSPPLTPGTGPVARVYYRTRSFATSGQTSVMTMPQLGSYALQATVNDVDYNPSFNSGTLTIALPPCDCPAEGDVSDNDGIINAIDLNGLIDVIFYSAPAPPVDPQCPHINRGDLNCDGIVDALDLNWMIDYIFFSGPNPCNPCDCVLYPTDCP